MSLWVGVCTCRLNEVFPNMKFHENPSSGILVVPCGQMDKRTDMMKPIVDFRRFAKVPKNIG
jgi:hypothetical protein